MLLFVADASAQRAFAARYSTNAKGDIAIAGNTVMRCNDTAGSNFANCANTLAGISTATAPINNNFTMINVDVDSDPTTFNSSSSRLSMLPGSTVLFAALYWAADSGLATRNTVKLQQPGATGYTTITASQIDGIGTVYQAFADVTAIVAAAGNGVYTAANVQSTSGATNVYGGWSLVVAYSNPASPTRNLAVYDGYQRVNSATVGGGINISLSGFITPPFGAVNTTIGTVAYDGDRTSTEGTSGLQFGPTATTLSPVFNAANPQNDYFNSTISDFGVKRTVASGQTPAYDNNLGVDIDLSKPNTPLPNNATSAVVRVSSSSETIDLGIVTLATDIFVPNIKDTLTKTVTKVAGAAGPATIPGDTLEYVVNFYNAGQDGALKTVLTDAIPANTTYLANSLSITTTPTTGAPVVVSATDGAGDDVGEFDSVNNRVVARVGAGANTTTGGQVVPVNASNLPSYSVKFRVVVKAATPGGTNVDNIARVDYVQQTLGGAVSDFSDSNSTTPGDQPARVIVAGPDLVVVKSDAGASFTQGKTGSYTLTVTNSGLAPSFGIVTVTETPPAGLTVTGLSGSGWTCAIATLKCTRSDALAISSSYPPITVNVDVAADAPVSVTNSATVSCACEATTATANNTGVDTTPITKAPVLTAIKSAGAAFIRGSTSTYTITVGASAAAGSINAADPVNLSDNLPGGVTLDGVPFGSGWTCTGTAGATSFSCSRTSALANGSAYPAITVPVRIGLAAPAFVDNTATASGGGATAPTSATVNTPIAASTDLKIAKTVDVIAPTLGNPNVEFSIRVTNDGPSIATNVVATDALPSGLTFVSSVPGQGSFSGSSWSVGTLAPGASATLRLRATVTNFASPITNTASVTGTEPDPVSSNNSAQITLQGQRADLSLTKTASNAVPNVGANVVFTLTVSNSGPDAATGVEVTDLLPATLAFVSSTSPAYDAATGKWAVGGLAATGAGSSAVLQITARPLVPGALINRAEISRSDQFDSDSTPGNNVAGEDDQAQVTLVAQQADLSISKAVDNPTPLAGETITYVITINNRGPSAATGVTVNEDVPAGLTLLSSTPSQGAFTQPVWAVGLISAGGSAALTISARYDGPGRVTNTASIASSDQPDPTPNTPVSVTVPSQIADLSLTKSVSNAAPNVGSNVTFTLIVRNAGPDDATGVVVADALPSGLSYVSASPSQGNYDAATGDWSVGSVANGGSATLAIIAKVTGLSPITNIAEIKSSRQFDPNSTPNNRVVSENDQASVTITPQSADLRLAKTVSPSNPSVASPVVRYTLTLSNLGPSTATNVAVAEVLPAGVILIAGSTTVSTGAFASATGIWSVPSLANGTSATLSFDATVSDFTKPLTNTAQITASDQPDPSPEPAATATVLGQRADLSLSKVADTATPNVGGLVTFTLRVANAGPDAATGVVVRDLLPSGLVFVSANASRGAYDSASGLWSIGSVANTAAETLTLVARVSQITGSAIVNRAEVAASDQFDPNSTPNNTSGTENDEASATLTPVPQADITVAKAAPSKLSPGANAVYKLIIRNLGPSAAQAVQVLDPTPAALTLVSVGGSGCTALPCGVGTLGPGESRTVDVTYRVDFPATASSVSNTVSAVSGTIDPAPGNNSATTTTPVVNEADLKIEKTGPATVVPGQEAEYSMTVTNLGPSVAPSAVLVDPTPAGVLRQVTSAPCASGFPCALGDIAIGASITVTSRYLAPAGLVGGAAIVNIASVTSNAADPEPANNTSRVQTAVESPQSDLSITKVGPANVLKGETVSFTLTVNNAGPSDAANAVITDPTPAGLTLISVTGDCTALPCTFAALPMGASKTARVTYQVPLNYAGTASPAAIDNTATVNSDSADTNPGNNGATFTTLAITPPPILTLAKTSSASFSRGGTGSYSINVAVSSSGGPTTGTLVTVSDALPAGITLVGAPSGSGWSCTSTSNTFSCTRSDVTAAGASMPPIVINVAIGLAADDSVTNTATVSGGGATASATGTVTTPVASSADLALSKGVDRNAPTLASPLVTFTLALDNLGPSTASNVNVSDLLPAGFSFVSATPSLGSYSAATGTWALGSVLPSTRATLQIRANVTDFSNTLVNTASVSSNTSDPNSSNNQARVEIRGQTANLSLQKLVDMPSPNVQSNVSFTLRVTNAGPDAASGVQVSDLLPAGLSFVSANPSGAYDAATGLWTVGGVPAGGSVALTVVAKVTGTAPVVNLAEISKSDQFDPNSTPGNASAGEDDAASATLIPQQSDLRLAKSVNNPNPVRGDTVVYTIEVANLGPSTATGVEIAEQLPSGVDYTDFVPSAGAFDAAAGLWTLASIPAGSSATLVISGTFRGPSAQTNTSTITRLDQFDPTPNAPVSVTIPSQIADLKLSKAVNAANPVQGSNVVFTLTASNIGPDPATGVTVTDLLPSGLVFVGATASSGGYNPATGVWAIGRINPSSNATLTITARVDSFAPLSNSAAVTASDQYDPNSIPGNNDATEDDQASVLVTPKYADLKLSKRVDQPAPTVASPNVAFSIELFNAGPDGATGISVTDLMPAGISLRNAAAAVGSYDSVSGLWTIPTLAAGARATLTLNGTVTDFTRPIINTAQITASGLPDPTPNEQASATVQGQIANLSLSKTVSQATPRVGSVIDFVLTVNNAGPDAATGVRVNDLLPPGLTLTGVASSAGNYDPATGVWHVGRVAVGVPAVLTLSARVSQTTSAAITNRAEITASDQFDPNSTPNNQRAGEDDQAEAILTPVPVADVTVAKLSPSQLNPGTDATYRVVVKNLGPSVAQNVTLADPGPTGLLFKSASCGAPPCALGNLAAGEDRTLSFVYSVPFPYTGAASVGNVATATSSTFDPDPGNNTDSAGASVDASADLNVIKTGPASIVPGTSASYSLVVTNRGPSAAADVVLEDPAQPGLTITSVSGGGCTSIPCTLGTLAPNASVTVTVNATLDATAVPGGNVRNSATVSATTPDPNLFDNTSTATSTVAPQSADVRVVKTGPAALSAGARAIYTLTVSNDGPSAAAGVVVNDTPGAGLTLVSVSGGNCVAVPCQLGTLLPGQIVVIRVEALVTASATVGQVLSNAATVSSSATDPNPGNNSITVTAPVSNQFADLSVRKTGPANAKPGDVVSYAIVVSNAGPSDARDVVITDTPSPGLSLLTTSGACTALPCTLPTLAVGATATVNVTARVAATVAPGATLINRAAATSAVPDLNPDNNSSDSSLVAAAIADLVTAISGPSQFTVGAPQTYDFAVINQGGAATTGPVTLTITLPQGTVASLTPPAGWTFTLVGQTLTLQSNNVVASLGTVRFPIQLTFSLPGSSQINARVSGGGEAVTTNNDASLALIGGAVEIPALDGVSLLVLLLLMFATVIVVRRGARVER